MLGFGRTTLERHDADPNPKQSEPIPLETHFHKGIRWLYLNSYQFILGKGMWKGSSPDPPDFLPTLLPGFIGEVSPRFHRSPLQGGSISLYNIYSAFTPLAPLILSSPAGLFGYLHVDPIFGLF
jgi:hypothetical protein